MAGPMRRLPKWLDRAGFEADKMMRATRVRGEASRMREQIDEKTHALGIRVLELASAGVRVDETLNALIDEIQALQGDAYRKEEEAKLITAETWVEPPDPVVATAPKTSRPQKQLKSTAGAVQSDPISQRLQAYVDSKNVNFNCPKCGAVIRSNASFCPRCGRKVIR